MSKNVIVWFIIFSFIFANQLLSFPSSFSQEKKENLSLLIPEKFYLGDELYFYHPMGEKYEAFYQVNLDDDSQKELVVRFVAFSSRNISRTIIMVVDGLKKYFVGLSTYPGKVTFYDIDKDKDQELILFSRSKVYYVHLYIFDYRKKDDSYGELKELFKKGSAWGIKLETEEGILRIKVGEQLREKVSFSPENYIWKVYVWDGEKFIPESESPPSEEENKQSSS